MLLECIHAYAESLTVKDKSSYVKAARMCAEYFDGQGITTPSADDWSRFREYVKQEYSKHYGKMPDDRTVKQNYEQRAKRFVKWCREAPQQASDISSSKGVKIMQTIRVNFNLDAQTYEILSVLAIMERKSLTELLNAAALLYVKENANKAEILRQAMEQVRQQDS